MIVCDAKMIAEGLAKSLIFDGIKYVTVTPTIKGFLCE
jgi:hypothetical protein